MRISERLRNGETSLVLWSANTDPQAMESIARSDIGTVVLDVQHGAHDERSIQRSVAICRSVGKPVMVRLPIERDDLASRSLDFGADGVIAPMINNGDDARRFATVCKYPPLGERSWGPIGDFIISGTRDGETYLNSANANTVALAMVETREAFDNIDAIIATEGIDGVFVGPSDFTVNWTRGELLSAKTDEILDAIRTVADKLKSAGKIAGIYASSPDEVERYHGMGYRLITATADWVALDAGIASALAEANARLG
jgi:4-hydroxy-2-oxoheptanedioate aldolase